MKTTWSRSGYNQYNSWNRCSAIPERPQDSLSLSSRQFDIFPPSVTGLTSHGLLLCPLPVLVTCPAPPLAQFSSPSFPSCGSTCLAFLLMGMVPLLVTGSLTHLDQLRSPSLLRLSPVSCSLRIASFFSLWISFTFSFFSLFLSPSGLSRLMCSPTLLGGGRAGW